MTGSFGGSVDFDPGEGVADLTSRGAVDGFVYKLGPDGSFQWVKQFLGDPRVDPFWGQYQTRCNAIAVDGDGDIIIAGSFVGICDVDPGPEERVFASPEDNPETPEDFDAFLVKLNPAGELIWAGHVGGWGSSHPADLAVDENGNIYGTGDFDGIHDWDFSEGTAKIIGRGLANPFVFKLGPDGNYVWAKAFGGSGADHGSAIAVDAAGNIVTVGEFGELTGDAIDFDPGEGVFELTPTGTFSGYASKFDKDGNFVWARSFNSDGTVFASNVATVAENVILRGSFSGTVDVDPGADIVELSDQDGGVFLLKLDSSGLFDWVKQINATSVIAANDEQFYTAGSFNGIQDFDPGPGVYELTSSGGSDGFVARYDARGRLHWARRIGGTENDTVSHIGIGNSIFIGRGVFSGTVDFDPGADEHKLTSPTPASFLFQWIPETTESIPPTIQDMPGDQTLTNEPGLATARATWAAPLAIDNVEVTELVSTHPPGHAFPVGKTTVTYTATDAAGNQTSASFSITIIDDEAPKIVDVPDDLFVGTDSGLKTAIVNWDEPSATDNVGVTQFASNHPTETAFAIGTTQVTYVATDAANNQTMATFRITVEDREPPVFSNIPNDIEIPNAPGKATAAVIWQEPHTSDNDSVSSTTSSHESGADFPLGETAVTYESLDPSGNKATASFRVTVIDVESPVLDGIPDDITMVTDTESAIVHWAAPFPSDNSGESTLDGSHESGSTFPLGKTIISYTASDAAGNQAEASFSITVRQRTGKEAYQAWLINQGYDVSTPAGGDANWDGLPNSFHYLLDVPIEHSIAHDPRNLLPQIRLNGDTGEPVFAFSMPKELPVGSSVHVETSQNASDWIVISSGVAGRRMDRCHRWIPHVYHCRGHTISTSALGTPVWTSGSGALQNSNRPVRVICWLTVVNECVDRVHKNQVFSQVPSPRHFLSTTLGPAPLVTLHQTGLCLVVRKRQSPLAFTRKATC